MPLQNPPPLYSDFPLVSHSIAEFNDRLRIAHQGNQAHFMRLNLSGEYEEDGETLQVLVDANRNQVEEDEPLAVERDIDSCLGISDHILFDCAISVWTIPPSTLALKSSIHLTREIMYHGTRHSNVQYHHIPNFELGSMGDRRQLNVFFPKLWAPELSKRGQPWKISEEKRTFWYERAFRPAIAALLGDHIASEWPPTFAAEKLRAAKSKKRAKPNEEIASTRLIPQEAVGHLADTIRRELTYDVFIDDEDREWVSDFFFIHTIRGVKDANRHRVDPQLAGMAAERFTNMSHLVHNHHLRGEWYIDIGIEISSPLGQCLQWSTAGHCSVVEEVLHISTAHATRITTLSSSKYSRDLVSHLSGVSGFRIVPGPQAQGPFQAAYIQAYTTDKTLTSNREGQYFAKFIEGKDALGLKQPPTTISSLHDIYTQAQEKNSSKARLEVRVPWDCGRYVLTEFNPAIFVNALYSFTREEWWEFRLWRVFAISNVLGLQSRGPTYKRFSPDSLLLTAACVWLVNSLHARPDDGPSSRDLMDAALPVKVAADVLDEQLAYPVSTNETNTQRVAYIPFGYVFLRRMLCGEVPRLRMQGPLLPSKSFLYFFGMDIVQLKRDFQHSGFVDNEVIEKTRFTTSKCKPPIYAGPREPGLFSLTEKQYEIPRPVIDDGSDVDESERPPTPDPANPDETIDDELAQLWRQFVSDLTSKSPNPRGGAVRPSYMKLTPTQRYSGSEEPYKNLRLYEIWTDVHYRNASQDDWEVCFNNLFPPAGFKSSTRRQGYKNSPYYIRWMEILELNVDNVELVEAIRAEFRKRVFAWQWMPKAESDKMWVTSFMKEGKKSFLRWPPSDSKAAAPFILLKEDAVPIFEPQEDDDAAGDV
ncbi:hypothetical protein NP233_g7516 [Leucocoprinus birnbaumii]|uniref:Uncharacterized protein n=1 Tax=Leucocoprinus birnbaumii TaxID=56174 RepID=A0AAD5VRQ6_9AGAR|nr:hypothetical protein NP233_g7516 [Leucocoprinus birnbaumii]